MLQQYLELKSGHPDALLLYRLGDFYELFFEDAERAAPILGVVLTRRKHNDEVTSPMCGIPHHALAGYMGKLLEAGLKVAVAEQVEDPASAGGLVRREVVRVATPGTVTDPELLGDGERRWIAAVVRSGEGAAVAFLEAASGELGGADCDDLDELQELLAQLRPPEVLLPDDDDGIENVWPVDVSTPIVTRRPALWFEPRRGSDLLCRTLGVASLKAFELEATEPLAGAAGALLAYLQDTQGAAPRHVCDFHRRRPSTELVLDAATVRNLELLRDGSGGRRGALATVLDRTVTAMGSRLLRDWLIRPAGEAATAAARHDACAALIDDPARLATVRDILKAIGDLERAAARLGLAQARPGELAALRAALTAIPDLRGELENSPSSLAAALARALDPLDDLRDELGRTLAEEPPALLGPGTVKAGRDAVLDEARSLSRGAKEVLAELEAGERKRTGIGNLRIRYNRVFGYAFEVSKAHLGRVPESWVRRQTLANAERFVTPELDDLQGRITSAEGRAEEREKEVFAELVAFCAERAPRLAATARAAAAIDVIAAFAEQARHLGYARPRLIDGAQLRVEGCRHPVIEALSHDPFIPNDVDLDGSSRQIIVLTGPNMGGKSTYLRQVALAVIMARAGSYVAADTAEIGDIDRIFTRVGAADDIARGESTFMVEMTEVAHILRHATPNSLVVLDEVGRGTATFDGLSLAWAVVEALHAGESGPLVLFATHYHELTDLATRLDRVANASLAVKEWGGSVIFLHRVVPGPSDRSYGIHVARLAGVPPPVCSRAEEVLAQLEQQELRVLEATAPAGSQLQLSLFPAPEHAVVEELRRISVDGLTPLEALNLLARLKAGVDS